MAEQELEQALIDENRILVEGAIEKYDPPQEVIDKIREN